MANQLEIKDDIGSGQMEKSEEYPRSIGVDEKKLLRRIDLKVMPMLLVIYVAAFLDRVNISNALTLNLPGDLHLVGIQPNIALTIFFIPYVLFEIPSNILMRHFKPHIWFSSCILAFGVFLLVQGFVQSYGGLLATRFLLGLAEAGIFPGGFYLISFWYRREEAQKRFTAYWCSVLVANMFGSLLASAVANMQGVGGYSNWRWIFILEGIATILIGVAAFFFVADFPDNSHWLTEEERRVLMDRVSRSRPDTTQKISMTDVAIFFRSPSNILGGIIYFSIIVTTYGFSYFTPTIVKSLGYSTIQTQLHTIPPFAAAFTLAMILAFVSDSTGLRTPYIIGCSTLTIIGLAILLSIRNRFSTQYAALCLVAMGSFSAGPLFICLYVMNLHGHAERSIGTAWMISFGNTGGVVATFAFLATEAPGYTQGYAACLAVSCVGLLSLLAYMALVRRENGKLMKSTADGKAWQKSF